MSSTTGSSLNEFIQKATSVPGPANCLSRSEKIIAMSRSVTGTGENITLRAVTMVTAWSVSRPHKKPHSGQKDSVTCPIWEDGPEDKQVEGSKSYNI